MRRARYIRRFAEFTAFFAIINFSVGIIGQTFITTASAETTAKPVMAKSLINGVGAAYKSVYYYGVTTGTDGYVAATYCYGFDAIYGGDMVTSCQQYSADWTAVRYGEFSMLSHAFYPGWMSPWVPASGTSPLTGTLVTCANTGRLFAGFGAYSTLSWNYYGQQYEQASDGSWRVYFSIYNPGSQLCYNSFAGIGMPVRVTAGNCTAAHLGINPCDIQDAYGLPWRTAGANETIAVVAAFDNPKLEKDLGTYRATYGLGACTSASGCFRKLNQAGNVVPVPTQVIGSPTPFIASFTTEASLDVQMISAACPLCKILVVEANSATVADLLAANDMAAARGANVIANTWGVPEYANQVNDGVVHLNKPGIAITAATGDTGYNGGVYFPAASRDVIAVGGTVLTKNPNIARGYTETGWGAATSGCSKYDYKPGWQTASTCAHRSVSDVSAVATNVVYYDAYSYGLGWQTANGTSISSPLVAAMIGLAGDPADLSGNNGASWMYARTIYAYDITSGANGTGCAFLPMCNSWGGWDGPTGIGTPNGVNIF